MLHINPLLLPLPALLPRHLFSQVSLPLYLPYLCCHVCLQLFFHHPLILCLLPGFLQHPLHLEYVLQFLQEPPHQVLMSHLKLFIGEQLLI